MNPLARLRSDIRPLTTLASPSTAATLWRAGMIDPKCGLALVLALPWYVGRGPTLGFVSQMNADAVGDKGAVRDRAGSLTWRELDRRANQLAHALQERGLKPSEGVATLLRNGREMIETIIAAQKVGMVVTPLNTWAKPKELAHTLDQANPKALVYDVLQAEQVRSIEPGDMELHAFVVGDPQKGLDGSITYEDALAAQPPTPPFPFALDRGNSRVVIHTSGTTGKPKGASRDPSTAGIREFLGMLSVVPFRRDDVIYCPAPSWPAARPSRPTCDRRSGRPLVRSCTTCTDRPKPGGSPSPPRRTWKSTRTPLGGLCGGWRSRCSPRRGCSFPGARWGSCT